MKRMIIEFTEEEYHLLEEAERKNELVSIKELLHKLQSQGRINVANI